MIMAKRSFFKRLFEYKVYLLMLFPAVAFTFIFSYIPLVGILIAFKDYNYRQGVFGSPWAGLNNFKFFFLTGQAAKVTSNTFWYNVAFIVTTTIASLMIAIFLSELISNKFKKISQTLIFLPHFISWVIVAALVYNLINYEYGMLNSILVSLGFERFNAYTTPSFWKYFIVLLNLWKGAGYGSVIYLATITGIDTEIYEAAKIDGANIFQRTRMITLPCLTPMIIILTLFSIGGIFRGNFEMFYNIIGNNSMLFDATDVIDTVVFRSLLNSSNLGMSTAIGVYQSVLCFITIMVTNALVKKIDPDSALF